MPRKQGNLRVLKQGQAIFGPMTRTDLEKLLAQQRLSAADQVSIDGGPWRMISAFLAETATAASPSRSPMAGTEREAVAPATVGAAPSRNLQVLRGNKIYGPMSRDQVMQLVQELRLHPGDLVCAIDGPWMPLTDFLAPVERVDPFRQDLPSGPAAAAPRSAPPGSPPQSMPPKPPALPAPMANARKEASIELTIADVVDEGPDELGPMEDSAISQMLPPLSISLLASDLEPPAPQLSTVPEWFVKIRGMPSSHLSKTQLKSLVMAREVHAETPTAHVGWDDNDWRPFQSIRELAGLLKFRSD